MLAFIAIATTAAMCIWSFAAFLGTEALVAKIRSREPAVDRFDRTSLEGSDAPGRQLVMNISMVIAGITLVVIAMGLVGFAIGGAYEILGR